MEGVETLGNTKKNSMKRKNGKKWGPVVAERKSLRTSQDTRTMEEKARDIKKIRNLEENYIRKGMKKKTPISISNNYSQKNYLANALDINIGEVDNLIFGDESIARMQDQNMSGSPLLEIENQLMGR